MGEKKNADRFSIEKPVGEGARGSVVGWDTMLQAGK
jgi:hypothetical protein